MFLNTKSIKLEYSVKDNKLVTEDKQFEGSVRKVSDMKPVLLDEEVVTDENSSEILYTMFRNASDLRHSKLYSENHIRYDVTVIENHSLGRESNKTFGHYHPVSGDGKNPYPEMYEVIEGESTFILQRETGAKTTEVRILDARKNDKILIPPGYGHISINRGKGKLILANLVSSEFTSKYEKIREKHGGAVYLIAKGSIMQNPHYSRISVNRYDVSEISWLDNKSSLYDQFVETPETFAFLNHPALLPQ